MFHYIDTFEYKFFLSPFIMNFNSYLGGFFQTPQFYLSDISNISKNTPLFNLQNSITSSDVFISSNKFGVGDVNQKMINKAKSYIGKVNSSAEGNRLFSPAGYQNTSWYKKYGRWGWCCDFAVSCAKQALGNKYPRNMITSSPAGLADAADKNGAYLRVPASNKNSWLAQNIKPGDIIYMKGKGDSGKHIAVVESVGADGRIKAVSGNLGGKVKSVNYNINTSGIYGFISLGRLSA